MTNESSKTNMLSDIEELEAKIAPSGALCLD